MTGSSGAVTAVCFNAVHAAGRPRSTSTDSKQKPRSPSHMKIEDDGSGRDSDATPRTPSSRATEGRTVSNTTRSVPTNYVTTRMAQVEEVDDMLDDDDDDDFVTVAGRDTAWTLNMTTDTWLSYLRWHTRRIINSTVFDLTIAVVIIANSATVGLEQSYRLDGKSTLVLDMWEHVFLTVYIVELLSRFFGFGLRCLADNWVRFDTFLVVMGVITVWIMEPLIPDKDALREIAPLMVLRTARLLRLARTVRLLIKFRELWMLVRGLLSSGTTIIYTLLLLTIVLYIFSCISMELITCNRMAEQNEEFKEIVTMYFPSLPMTMLTLVQFISLDNVTYIYGPLIKLDWTLTPYFAVLILVVSIVLMNLVTAVIVNSALEQAMQDKSLMKSLEDKKRKRLVKELRRIFIRLDEDDSGEVSRREIEHISEEDQNLLTELLAVSNPIEIFDALDVDGSGDLAIDEFIDGVWQVSVSNAPIELKRVEKHVEAMRRQMANNVVSMNEAVRDLREDLSTAMGVILAKLKPAEGSTYDSQAKVHTSPSRSLCESARDDGERSPTFQQSTEIPTWDAHSTLKAAAVASMCTEVTTEVRTFSDTLTREANLLQKKIEGFVEGFELVLMPGGFHNSPAIPTNVIVSAHDSGDASVVVDRDLTNSTARFGDQPPTDTEALVSRLSLVGQSAIQDRRSDRGLDHVPRIPSLVPIPVAASLAACMPANLASRQEAVRLPANPACQLGEPVIPPSSQRTCFGEGTSDNTPVVDSAAVETKHTETKCHGEGEAARD
eukprot:TRINITY_DN37979_c0_g1_i1.p1 TRINITY_DN37979_c0_g1~~TRINITY_DN37979_c0_g1_i1.p1  ORF type:complete len:778 (-),score=131.77 TRINITY_DN37979_c0_g1_i1:71-2404(-)